MSTSYNKTRKLARSVSQCKEKKVLDKLAKEGTHVFHKNWAFIPSNIGFNTMRSLSYMIPQLVVNHFNDIKNGRPRLFSN